MSRTIFIILLLFSINLSGQNKDAALWSSIQAEFSPLKDLDAKIETGYRLQNNFKATDKLYAEAALEYKIWDYLRIAGEYRFSEKYNVEDNFYAERHRVMIKIKTGAKLDDFGFSWTGKFQTSFYDPTEHNWNNPKYISHLRHRFQIKYRNKKCFVYPYTFYEFYIPLKKSDVFYLKTDAYRIAGGLEFKILKNNFIKTFFMYEEEMDEHINRQNYIYGLAYSHQF